MGGRRWQRLAFPAVGVVAALLFLVLFGSIFALFMPWVPEPPEGPGYSAPKDHRWHDAQWGAHTAIMLAGSCLLLLRRPERKPLLAQFLAVAILIYTMLAVWFEGAGSLIALIPVAVLIVLYPDRQRLLEMSHPRGWNLPLLALAVVAALVALPYALDMLRLQIDNLPGDEHAEFTHWVGALLLLLNLLAAGVLAASRRPGSRTLAALAGGAFIYLGIAALTSLDGEGGGAASGTWSPLAALLSLLAGAGYLALGVFPRRLAVWLPWLPWLAERPATDGVAGD